MTFTSKFGLDKFGRWKFGAWSLPAGMGGLRARTRSTVRIRGDVSSSPQIRATTRTRPIVNSNR